MQALVFLCFLIVGQVTLISANESAQVAVTDFGVAQTVVLGDGADLYWGFSIEVKNTISLQSIVYQERSIWASREQRLSNTTEMIVAEFDKDGIPVSTMWQGWLTGYSQDFEDVRLLGGHVYTILIHTDWQDGAQTPNAIRNQRLEGRDIDIGEAYVEDEDIAIFQSLDVWVPAQGKEAPFYGRISGYLPAIKELRFTSLQQEDRTTAKAPRKQSIRGGCSRFTSMSILRVFFTDSGDLSVKLDNQMGGSCSEVLTGRGAKALRENWEKLTSNQKKPAPATNNPSSSSSSSSPPAAGRPSVKIGPKNPAPQQQVDGKRQEHTARRKQ